MSYDYGYVEVALPRAFNVHERPSQYVWLKGVRNQVQDTKEACQRRIEQANGQLAMLDALIEQLREGICPHCGGHGKINVWFAQDDCKLETCKHCDGMGLEGGHD